MGRIRPSIELINLYPTRCFFFPSRFPFGCRPRSVVRFSSRKFFRLNRSTIRNFQPIPFVRPAVIRRLEFSGPRRPHFPITPTLQSDQPRDQLLSVTVRSGSIEDRLSLSSFFLLFPPFTTHHRPTLVRSPSHFPSGAPLQGRTSLVDFASRTNSRVLCHPSSFSSIRYERID